MNASEILQQLHDQHIHDGMCNAVSACDGDSVFLPSSECIASSDSACNMRPVPIAIVVTV